MGEDTINLVRKIHQEVDDHTTTVLVSDTCLKSKRALLEKLEEKSNHQASVINSITSFNLQQQKEIALHEQNIRSFHTSLLTIKSSNNESNKDLLKERRSEVEQRVNNGIQRYELLWTLANKSVSTPIRKKHAELKSKVEAGQAKLAVCLQDNEQLEKLIHRRAREVTALDRGRVLKLAQFLARDKGRMLLALGEQQAARRRAPTSGAAASARPAAEAAARGRARGAGLQIPTIHLDNMNLECLDGLHFRLEQIRKAQSLEHGSTAPPTRVKEPTKITDPKEPSSDLAAKSNAEGSKQKLIHVVQDIALNNYEAKDILTKMSRSDLRRVEVITAKDAAGARAGGADSAELQPTPMGTAETQGDLPTKSQSIILPPTQFLDTQLKSLSQEKKVSFEFKQPQDPPELDSSAPPTAAASDDFCRSMKTMKQKRNQLDNGANPNEKKPKVDNVTSKFFEAKENLLEGSDIYFEMEDIQRKMTGKSASGKLDDPMPSSSKDDAEQLSGFIFNHGVHGLMESLDISSTDNANGESVYAQPIDTSLLLSPKADEIQIEKQQKDIFRNFFTGFGKAGRSLFGGASGNQNEDTNSGNQDAGNESYFNFNFDSEPKKKGDFLTNFN